MGLLDSIVLQVFGDEASIDSPLKSVGGGCINNTGVFGCDGKKYFLKWNLNAEDLFGKERKGLELLVNTQVIGIPEVVGSGKAENYDFLCIEFIDKRVATKKYWDLFGEQLASLHRITNTSFGLDFDNHIGKLPQYNDWTVGWVDFFIDQRIVPQLKMARSNRLLTGNQIKEFDALFTKLDSYFPKEVPSLIHGDLWSGNIMAGQNDQPYIFDPAVYFGHREAELAFTHMFGGFDRQFYDSYNSNFSMESGFNERIDLYNLYPLLVHLNLFGTSYLSGIQNVLRRFT